MVVVVGLDVGCVVTSVEGVSAVEVGLSVIVVGLSVVLVDASVGVPLVVEPDGLVGAEPVGSLGLAVVVLVVEEAVPGVGLVVDSGVGFSVPGLEGVVPVPDVGFEVATVPVGLVTVPVVGGVTER